MQENDKRFSRDYVLDAARECVGWQFRRGGRDHRGIDCIGLLVVVATKMGQEVEDMHTYNLSPKPALMQEMILKQSAYANPNNLKKGMIVLLRDSFNPFHCGIIGVDSRNLLTVINAHTGANKVIEQPMAKWAGKILMARDFLKVTK